MSEDQKRGADFEERLLTRLKAVVAERDAAEAGSTAPGPGWRRPARLAFGAAAAIAAAALVLVFSSGGDNTPKAFAVEPQDGGGVTIRVYSLEDASGLEEALEDAGIEAQVTWLSAGETCRQSRFKPSTVKTSLGGRIGGMTMAGPVPALTIGIMSAGQYRKRWREYRRGEISAAEYRESTPSLSLDPSEFRPDQSVVIFGSPQPHGGDPEGGYQAHFAVAQGPVEPCRPVPAPAASIGAIALASGSGDGAGHAPGAGEAPAPGQFLYSKSRLVELQGWEPEGPGAGPRSKPRRFTANLLGPEANALPALVSTTKEVWTAADGRTRVREVLDRVEFLSAADQGRWEAAGSPPPFAYDPTEHDVRRDGSGHLVKEYASHNWRGRHAFSNVAKLAQLPTDSEALRLAIEGHRPGGAPAGPAPARSSRGAVTAERLIEILGEPIVSPPLLAAAFGALAEIPGLRLKHGVADVAGRRGDAVAWVRERGFGREAIFDPRTSRVLAQAEMIFGPSSSDEYGVPPGTVFRETAYLGSRIVAAGAAR
jgi:hypothetical protein